MIYDGREYRLLLVSASAKFNESFEALLPQHSLYRMEVAGTVAAAEERINENSFDVIIINSPLPDHKGIRLAKSLGRRRDCVCMVIVRSQDYESTYSNLVQYGVFTLEKPLSAKTLKLAFRWLETAREHIRSRRDAEVSLESRLQGEDTISRAKRKLMESKGISEGEAYAFIRKEAMDRCVSKEEVADRILKI